jgi:hypothetical protein
MVLRLLHIERTDDGLPPIADADDIGHQRVVPIPVARVPPKGGTYSPYSADYPRMARGYCLLGATNRQLGELFGVTPQTLNNWMHDHPEFAEAIEEGRTKADLFVADGLYRRATGYTQKVRMVVRERKFGPSTTTVSGEVIPGPQIGASERETETEMHVPPDASAASRWLHLRQNIRDPDGNTLTVDDIIRIAEMARAEAARRGIDYASAIDSTAEAMPPG